MQGLRVQPIAGHFGRKPSAIYAKARQMGLPKRPRARLQNGPLPLFDFVSLPLGQTAAKRLSCEAVPLDWSRLVGSHGQQPEQLLLPDMDPEPLPAAAVEPDPEPERPLPVLRRMSVPVPATCRGFKAPQTREEFDRFCKSMVSNTFGSIRSRLTGVDASNRDDAVQEIYLDLLEWFVGESPKFPGRPRYLNYDPSHNIEFWQWYCKMIHFRVKEYWKGVKRGREAGIALSTWDSDKEIDLLDTLVEGDTTAAIALRSAPVSVENVADLGAFMRLATRISDHHAQTKSPRFRAAASFTALIHGIQCGFKPEEHQQELQDHVIHEPVSLNSVKSWTTELFNAARMFNNFGSKSVLEHYGVPV